MSLPTPRQQQQQPSPPAAGQPPAPRRPGSGAKRSPATPTSALNEVSSTPAPSPLSLPTLVSPSSGSQQPPQQPQGSLPIVSPLAQQLPRPLSYETQVWDAQRSSPITPPRRHEPALVQSEERPPLLSTPLSHWEDLSTAVQNTGASASATAAAASAVAAGEMSPDFTLVPARGELAVIPYGQPVLSQKEGSGSSAENSPNGNGVGSSSLRKALPVSVRRVCPTCLRPFDERDAGNLETTTSALYPPKTSAFTPHYFRALAAALPLAIGNGESDTSATVNSGSLVPPERRLPTVPVCTSRSDSPPLSNGGGVLGDDRSRLAGEESVGVSPSLVYYVSPTGADVTAGFPPRRRTSGNQDGPSAPIQLLGVTDEAGVVWNAGQDDEQEGMLPPPLMPSRSPGHQHELSKQNEDGASTRYTALEEQMEVPVSGGSAQGYYEKYFVEVQKLGSGTYGGVYLCQHVMEGVSLGTFALKKIPVGDNIAYLQNVLREVRILEEVKRHPNVVEYKHSWVDVAQLADFGPPVRCLFILMEYATEGSLDAYLQLHGTALSTVAVWYFFLSAVAGTAHLHQKHILHRDLKPQNLLLTGPPGKPPRVLVSDFGTAALLGDISYDRTGGTGTLEYMAPELLECAPCTPTERYVNRHTKASDVWSLGMILHYLSCDATLPARLPDGSVALNVSDHSPFPRPPEMVELMRAMLQRDPQRRPSCNDILKSTVVQTILRSFNNVNLTNTDILSSPSNIAVTGEGSGGGLNGNSNRYRRRGNAGKSDEEDDGAGVDRNGDPLREELYSSRVELVSASAVNEVPLLLQYTSAIPRGSQSSLPPYSGEGGDASRMMMPSETIPSSSPLAAGPKMLKRQRMSSITSIATMGGSHTGGGGGGLAPPRRRHMVDAGVQTDSVTIVDTPSQERQEKR